MWSVTVLLASACLAVQYVKASVFLQTKGPEMSALHEVVGHDGVLVIRVDRGDRKSRTTPNLNKVGIYPTVVAAVDVESASRDALREGCLPQDERSTSFACGGSDVPGGREGLGCKEPVEQAIAASHRKALLQAQSRNATWTAIIEDDVVPILPEHFNTNFKDVWAQMPSGIGLVRLGWCPLRRGTHAQNVSSTSDHFDLVSGHGLGGCTTAYMVHRDFVPTMLGIFPCCTAVDACYALDLLLWPRDCGMEDTEKCWGQKYVMGIDTPNSVQLTKKWATFSQRGILAQDNIKSSSIKEKARIDKDWRKRAIREHKIQQ